MILNTNQVEGVVYVLSLAGAGWGAYFTSGQNRLVEDLKKAQESVKTQWQKIDEVRDKQSTFVTRDLHDDTKKEINAAISEAIGGLSKNLTEAINKLSDRLDQVIMHEHGH